MAVGTEMDLAQEHASATAVQAQFKGFCARKERDQIVASATTVQAAYRAYDARSQVAGGEWRQRYYTPAEISKHDSAEDLWVSVFDKVGASPRE
jgi:cytochrome b involved in lipid metabolism